MEIAARFKLFTLFTQITPFTLLTLHTLLILLLPPTLYTLLTLFKQLWSKKAIMPVHTTYGYIALSVSEQRVKWVAGVDWPG